MKRRYSLPFLSSLSTTAESDCDRDITGIVFISLYPTSLHTKSPPVMLVAALEKHNCATEIKDSPWEYTPNLGRQRPAESLQTCPSADASASSSGQANGVSQIQGSPGIPCGTQQFTADFGQPIRNDSRSALQAPLPPTIATPSMSDLKYARRHIDDVLGLVPMTVEPFDIDGDMVVEECPPTPPFPFDMSTEPTQSNDDSVFQTMCRNAKNLVFDSTNPDIMPHIVITPPDNNWDVGAVLSSNRVDLQYTAYLAVPQCDASKWARMPPSDGEFHLQQRKGAQKLPQPKAVFSPSKFMQWVECSANERLIVYHVALALQKLQLKAVAYQACQAVQQFRQRYHCPEFVRSLEKPFKWTDPAEPLLACASLAGNTILDSISPLTVPHIIITEPLPEDLWIAWRNSTNNPQDSGFGAYLTVPSRLVTFINQNRCQPESESDVAMNDVGVDLFDCESRPDTPAPETPMFGICNETDDDVVMICCSLSASYNMDIDMDASLAREMERPSCDIFGHYDNEDEDGPPPFDDWYLDILERTGGNR